MNSPKGHKTTIMKDQLFALACIRLENSPLQIGPQQTVTAILSRLFDGQKTSYTIADVLFEKEQRKEIFTKYHFLIVNQPQLAQIYLTNVLFTKLRENNLIDSKGQLNASLMKDLSTHLVAVTGMPESAVTSDAIFKSFLTGLTFDAQKIDLNVSETLRIKEFTKMMEDAGLEFAKVSGGLKFNPVSQALIATRLFESDPNILPNEEGVYPLSFFEDNQVQLTIMSRVLKYYNELQPIADNTESSLPPENPIAAIRTFLSAALSNLATLITKTFSDPEEFITLERGKHLLDFKILLLKTRATISAETPVNTKQLYNQLNKIKISLLSLKDTPEKSMRSAIELLENSKDLFKTLRHLDISGTFEADSPPITPSSSPYSAPSPALSSSVSSTTPHYGLLPMVEKQDFSRFAPQATETTTPH